VIVSLQKTWIKPLDSYGFILLIMNVLMHLIFGWIHL